jgi:RNA polymerase sigma-70 factor (ECF subfamily)
MGVAPVRRSSQNASSGLHLRARAHVQFAEVVPPFRAYDASDVAGSVETNSSVQNFAATEALAHVDALYAFAWRLAGSRATAEDLVQETFARGWAAAERFEPGSNLKAWLFRILRNTFLDLRRREKRQLRALNELGETPDLDETAALGHADWELDQIRRLSKQDIEVALGTLTEDQRSVVLLDLEGFTELEVAEVMGCAAGTVKSRLARARATLRVQLGKYSR